MSFWKNMFGGKESEDQQVVEPEESGSDLLNEMRGFMDVLRNAFGTDDVSMVDVHGFTSVAEAESFVRESGVSTDRIRGHMLEGPSEVTLLIGGPMNASDIAGFINGAKAIHKAANAAGFGPESDRAVATGLSQSN